MVLQIAILFPTSCLRPRRPFFRSDHPSTTTETSWGNAFMPGDDLTIWMWSEACRHLERAETLHRRFYGIAGDSTGFSWEPPADVFETEREVLIEVALPGVSADALEVSVQAGVLVVRGERGFPEIP